jgi:hypothetical protein
MPNIQIPRAAVAFDRTFQHGHVRWIIAQPQYLWVAKGESGGKQLKQEFYLAHIWIHRQQIIVHSTAGKQRIAYKMMTINSVNVRSQPNRVGSSKPDGHLIVNKMIGTGIFITPATIVVLAGSKYAALLLWCFGSFYSIIRQVEIFHWLLVSYKDLTNIAVFWSTLSMDLHGRSRVENSPM